MSDGTPAPAENDAATGPRHRLVVIGEKGGDAVEVGVGPGEGRLGVRVQHGERRRTALEIRDDQRLVVPRGATGDEVEVRPGHRPIGEEAEARNVGKSEDRLARSAARAHLAHRLLQPCEITRPRRGDLERRPRAKLEGYHRLAQARELRRQGAA